MMVSGGGVENNYSKIGVRVRILIRVLNYWSPLCNERINCIGYTRGSLFLTKAAKYLARNKANAHHIKIVWSKIPVLIRPYEYWWESWVWVTIPTLMVYKRMMNKRMVAKRNCDVDIWVRLWLKMCRFISEISTNHASILVPWAVICYRH